MFGIDPQSLLPAGRPRRLGLAARGKDTGSATTLLVPVLLSTAGGELLPSHLPKASPDKAGMCSHKA